MICADTAGVIHSAIEANKANETTRARDGDMQVRYLSTLIRTPGLAFLAGRSKCLFDVQRSYLGQNYRLKTSPGRGQTNILLDTD